VHTRVADIDPNAVWHEQRWIAFCFRSNTVDVKS